MSETDTGGGPVTRDRLLLALVLLVGIAGTGVLRRQLGLLGYNELGRIVFVLGYGGMVFVIWYGWIRPLDITGPTGNADVSPYDGDASDANGAETGDEADGADDRPADARAAGAERDRNGRTER